MTDIFDDLIVDLKSKNDLLVTVSETDIAEIKDYIPTLIPQYDRVLVGGIPANGRITEIFGEKSTGKTSFAGTIAGIGQKMGAFPIMFDVEGTTDKDRLRELGVDPNKVLTRIPEVKKNGEVEPLTIESIMQDMIDLSIAIHDKNPQIVPFFIWDSIAPTQSGKQDKLGLGDQQQPAMQAKSLTEGLRKLQPNLTRNNAVLIALNQARDDMDANAFLGKQIKTIGGRGWEHALSTQIFMKRGQKIKKNSTDTTEIGHVVKLQLKKSKVDSNAGLEGLGNIYQEGAFDLGKNLFEEAIDLGIIKASGSWGYYILDDTDTEIKMQRSKWGDYLDSEEGQPALNEIWRKAIKAEFPELYPPLFNSNAVMTVERFPMIEGLREYYIDIQESLPDERQHTLYKSWLETQN